MNKGFYTLFQMGTFEEQTLYCFTIYDTKFVTLLQYHQRLSLFRPKSSFFLVKVILDKAIIGTSIDKFSGLLCFSYIKFLIYFEWYEISSNDGYIAREEMMALLQNCLNLSGQEEEGEDGIKVTSKSSFIHWSLLFHSQHPSNIGCK